MSILMNLLIPLCSIVGFYFTTRPQRHLKKSGAIIGLAGQPLWFYTINTDQWGVLIVGVFFTFIYFEIALKNWNKTL